MNEIRSTSEAMGPAVAPGAAKSGIAYACEACRVAKVKCQGGSVEGICRRCAVTKRECITKVGPRPRRRKLKHHPAATRSTPPPSAPSRTFTIDIPIGTEDDDDEETPVPFDMLRETHEGIIDDLIQKEGEDDDLGYGTDSLMTGPPSSTSGSKASRSASTPSFSARTTHFFSSVQPQFNLESATSLLLTFRERMLPYFPVVVLPLDASVSTLARERPFILLAILAAASACGSLQGHNLYNEEFRKVLGLKVVSSGERSVELLTGLLIYCAWFPLHLRPKNKQIQQYTRMAIDIVRDLELDQRHDAIDFTATRASSKRMDAVRAYLGAYLICSRPATPWKPRAELLRFEDWTATCCELFADPQSSASDQTLGWHIRLQYLLTETIKLNNRRGGGDYCEEQRVLLLLKGMEAQFWDFQAQMSAEVASQPVIHLALLAISAILPGAPLFTLSHNKQQPNRQHPMLPFAEPANLATCTTHLRTWFSHLLSLPGSSFAHFTGAIWEYIVATIVIALRLSFPLPAHYRLPGWDHAAARQGLGLGGFLARFADIGGGDMPRSSTSADVLSASKVVMDVVRRKYEKRLAALELAAQQPVQDDNPLAFPQGSVDRTLIQCPMLDGSLDQYIAEWDGSTGLDATYFAAPALGFGPESANGGTGLEQETLSYNDLWAAMTMGWTQDEAFPARFDGGL